MNQGVNGVTAGARDEATDRTQVAPGVAGDRMLKEQVADLIYRSTVLLDREDFQGWLEEFCAPEFRYRITTYSPEIRREQEWLEGGREDLLEMMRMLPMHNTDHSPLTRHVSVYTVDLDGGNAARAVSSVVIYRTMFDGINSHLDSGETRLFAVGKYLDTVRIDGEQPLFLE